MKPFIDAGIPILSITYRNVPGSPTRGPGGPLPVRVPEWEDLKGAVRYAVDNGAAAVLQFGISTGAAIAVSFMSQSDLAPEASGLDFGAAVSQEASNGASRRSACRYPRAWSGRPR